VQDAYSVRCAPQVHGVAHDTIAFVKSVLDVELNSATDNPMVFPHLSGEDGDVKARQKGATDIARLSLAPTPSCPCFLLRLACGCLTPARAFCVLRVGCVLLAWRQWGLVMPDPNHAGELPSQAARVDGETAQFGDEGKGFKTHKRPSDLYYGAPGGFVISGGNFHGE